MLLKGKTLNFLPLLIFGALLCFHDLIAWCKAVTPTAKTSARPLQNVVPRMPIGSEIVSSRGSTHVHRKFDRVPWECGVSMRHCPGCDDPTRRRRILRLFSVLGRYCCGPSCDSPGVRSTGQFNRSRPELRVRTRIEPPRKHSACGSCAQAGPASKKRGGRGSAPARLDKIKLKLTRRELARGDPLGSRASCQSLGRARQGRQGLSSLGLSTKSPKTRLGVRLAPRRSCAGPEPAARSGAVLIFASMPSIRLMKVGHAPRRIELGLQCALVGRREFATTPSCLTKARLGEGCCVLA